MNLLARLFVTHRAWENRCAAMMGDWLDSLKATRTMFEEAGVKLRSYDGPLNMSLGEGLLRGKPVLAPDGTGIKIDGIKIETIEDGTEEWGLGDPWPSD